MDPFPICDDGQDIAMLPWMMLEWFYVAQAHGGASSISPAVIKSDGPESAQKPWQSLKLLEVQWTKNHQSMADFPAHLWNSSNFSTCQIPG